MALGETFAAVVTIRESSNFGDLVRTSIEASAATYSVGDEVDARK
jgi:hypothetical protein